jgi:hypothetical protein
MDSAPRTPPFPHTHPRPPHAQSQAARAPEPRRHARLVRGAKSTASVSKTRRLELAPPKMHALKRATSNRFKVYSPSGTQQWCGSSWTTPLRAKAQRHDARASASPPSSRYRSSPIPRMQRFPSCRRFDNNKGTDKDAPTHLLSTPRTHRLALALALSSSLTPCSARRRGRSVKSHVSESVACSLKALLLASCMRSGLLLPLPARLYLIAYKTRAASTCPIKTLKMCGGGCQQGQAQAAGVYRRLP